MQIVGQHFDTATFMFQNVAIELQPHQLIYVLIGRSLSNAGVLHMNKYNAQYIEHEFVVGVYDISDCQPCTDAQPKILEHAMYYRLHRSSTCAAILLVFSNYGDALPDAIATQMTM